VFHINISQQNIALIKNTFLTEHLPEGVYKRKRDRERKNERPFIKTRTVYHSREDPKEQGKNPESFS